MTKSKKSIFVQELDCRLFYNFQHNFSYVSLTFTQIFDLQSPFFYEVTEMQTCLLKQQKIIFQPLQSRNPEIWEILLVQPVFMKCIMCPIYVPICKNLLFLTEFWNIINLRGHFQAIKSNKPLKMVIYLPLIKGWNKKA